MKHKTFFLILIYVAFGYFAVAQNKVERFCKIYVLHKSENKQKISINMGNTDGYTLKDSTEINKLLKVNDLTNDIDVLNYMAALGWQFISNQALNVSFFSNYIFFFKKTFDR